MIDEPLALLAEAFGQDVSPAAAPVVAEENDPSASARDGIVPVIPLALSPIGTPIPHVL